MTHRTAHRLFASKQDLRQLTDFGIINVHRLRGDPEKFTLIVDETQAISCTPTEYRTAARLFRSPKTPITFAQFKEGVYLPEVDHRAVIRAMSTLRQKLAPLGIQITNVKTYRYMITFTDKDEKS
jgi:DNA-binding response OmpR family regulator